jgi:transposase
MGLDLGLKRTSVCVIDDDGQTLHEQECESSLPALQCAISPFPTERIGMIAVEAGTSTEIVRKLRRAGFPVAMFEARKASKFLAVRRNKTDAGDAKGLADLARLGRNTISRVYLKSPECQQISGQLALRKKLVQLRVAIEGVVRSKLALHGRELQFGCGHGAFRSAVEEEIASIKEEADGADLADDLRPLVTIAEGLRDYLRTLDAKLERLAASHDVCRLLMDVPGVGPICSLSFYSAVEDPSRFRSPADVGAYLGLVPRRYQSGRVSKTVGITKTGSKLTRASLFTAATVFGFRAPDCALKDWYTSLRQRAGSRRARVALARKLAIVLLTMWKNRARFEPYPSGHAANRAGVDETAGPSGIRASPSGKTCARSSSAYRWTRKSRAQPRSQSTGERRADQETG